MANKSVDERACREDTLQRVNKWLNKLEGQIGLLLSTNDVELMKPGEREQAASRYLQVLLRLLQLRQQCVVTDPSSGEQALIEAILRHWEEEEID